MSRPPISWLITDTHFYHQKMVTECHWPPDYVDAFIRNCRHLICRQDILYHLGDVIFYKYPELLRLLGQIPGRKILLRGNHDRKTNGWYMRNGFHFVADQIVLGDVLLSHEPQQFLGYGVKYNIHGHLHTQEYRVPPNWCVPKRHFSLSIEEQNFGPVNMAEFLNGRLRND